MLSAASLRIALRMTGLCILVIHGSLSLYAATRTWDGDISDDDWADAGNWDTLPTDDSSTDAAKFTSTDGDDGDKIVDLSTADRSVGSVFIDADGYTFQGSKKLTIGNGAIAGSDPDGLFSDAGQFFLTSDASAQSMTLDLDLAFTGNSHEASKFTIGKNASITVNSDLFFDNTATVTGGDDYKHIHTGVTSEIVLNGKLNVDFGSIAENLIIDLGTPGTYGSNNGTLTINSSNLGNININTGQYIRLWDGKYLLGADDAFDNVDIRMEMGSNNSLLITGSYTQQNAIELYANNINSDRLHVLGGTNTSGTALFSGDIAINHVADADPGSFGYARLDFEAATGGTVRFSGSLSAGTNVNAPQQHIFRKTGDGTVVLENSNNFDNGSGGNPALEVVGGILQITHAEALGGASGSAELAVTVADGATLDIVNSITYAPDTDISLSGDGYNSLGALRSSSGTNTLTGSGDVVLLADASIGVDNGAQLSLDRAVTGAFALTKTGAGDLILNSASTYTGDTVISDGRLQMGGDDFLASSSDLSLQGGTLSTDGYDLEMANLTLTSDSSIDLGSGSSILEFAGVGSFTGGQTLTFLQWTGTLDTAGGTDQILFNTDMSAYLNQMTIDGYSDIAQIDLGGGLYEIVGSGGLAVPETSTLVTTCLMLLGSLGANRKRLIHSVSTVKAHFNKRIR